MSLHGVGRTVAWLAILSLSSHATPSRAIQLDERLFGANEESYTVLRTAVDNEGSYYSSTTTTTLFERSIETDETIRETVVLKSRTIIDANYTGPEKAPVETVIQARGETASLTEMVERWPIQGVKLDPKLLEGFKVISGSIYFRQVFLTHPAGLVESEKQPNEEQPAPGWQVMDGRYAGGATILKVVRGDVTAKEGPTDGVWVALNPETAVQVNKLSLLPPTILSLGSAKDLAGAQEIVRNLKPIPEGPDSHLLEVAIWNFTKTNERGFHVVATASDAIIRNEKVAEFEQTRDARLTPVPTDSFTKWIAPDAK
ncbi:hypothetical protein OVA24_01265 [Luteolibacter sp. SL250]|uniref:hypothetical protein n=1 Tax=Luteolibacter sp. SL250 TaxID=2995170 RepID=UPI00227005AF|nr:hypothetical protein [Luteolibacter sp. SL250]WAC20006.1 hypothetical protein OVA24_01265 [Luteolibacter sp. SL250]